MKKKYRILEIEDLELFIVQRRFLWIWWDCGIISKTIYNDKVIELKFTDSKGKPTQYVKMTGRHIACAIDEYCEKNYNGINFLINDNES